MNTIELKKLVTTFLKTKTSRVFNEQVPAPVVYPYVVYSLESSETDENQKMEQFELIIDVYDNKQFDLTALDTLVGEIDGDGSMTSATGLHRKHYYVANTLRADFYRYSRDKVDEKDQNINHIELNYDIYVYLT